MRPLVGPVIRGHGWARGVTRASPTSKLQARRLPQATDQGACSGASYLVQATDRDKMSLSSKPDLSLRARRRPHTTGRGRARVPAGCTCSRPRIKRGLNGKPDFGSRTPCRTGVRQAVLVHGHGSGHLGLQAQ